MPSLIKPQEFQGKNGGKYDTVMVRIEVCRTKRNALKAACDHQGSGRSSVIVLVRAYV